MTHAGWMLIALSACGGLSFQRGPLIGAPASASFIEVEGTRIRYVDEGAGPAVVLIHGFNSSLEVWSSVIDSLRDSHRVIAIDQRGFGFSDRPAGDYGPAAQATVIAGVMDALTVGSASVVGHSWGASVALALAQHHPERVHRLALYSAWVYDDQLTPFVRWSQLDGLGEALAWLFYDERWAERIELGFYDPDRIPPPMIERAEATASRDGATAVALAVMRGQRFDVLESAYASIAAPTLVLWGRDDRIATVRFGERLQTDLPDAHLIVYPRCGHYPMIECPSSSAALRDFLAADGEPRT